MKKTLLITLLVTPLIFRAQTVDTLYSTQDAYVVTFGGGQGMHSFIKFDISTIPPGATINSVQLNLMVFQSSPNWDTDVNFKRMNDQNWVETDPAITLFGIPRTGLIYQQLGFGSGMGPTTSIDIKNLFLTDYMASNNYFSVYAKDSDDMTCCSPMGCTFNPPACDSPDTLGIGNAAFNQFILTRPREAGQFIGPKLIVNYTILTGASSYTANFHMLDVFPVPAKEILYIRLEGGAEREFNIEFMDLKGSKVLVQKGVVPGVSPVNISELLPGLYIMGVKDDLGNLTHKKILIPE